MKDNIKRVIVGILIIFVVVIVLVLTLRKNDYSEISYTKLNEMIEKKESFVLVIGSATCSHCKIYRQTMKRVIKNYQVDIKYIDVSKLDNDEKVEMTSKINYSGTPTTVFITNGIEESTYNRIDGSKSYEKIIEKLIKNGYIKE